MSEIDRTSPIGCIMDTVRKILQICKIRRFEDSVFCKIRKVRGFYCITQVLH